MFSIKVSINYSIQFRPKSDLAWSFANTKHSYSSPYIHLFDYISKKAKSQYKS